MTPEEIKYLLHERVGILIHDAGKTELQAVQEARREIMELLRAGGMAVNQAAVLAIKAEREDV